MAPIRRYLRISKFSVLECRIFLENPADGPRWLLKTSDPALPRVIAAVKPLVLPKLREENERVKGKGKKKKKVLKDVIHEGLCFHASVDLCTDDGLLDDFDVSIFLTEIGSRHSILTKNKTFRDKEKLESNSNKLTGQEYQQTVTLHGESSDDSDSVALHEIPMANPDALPEAVQLDSSDDDTSMRRANFDRDEDDDKKKLGFQTTYEGFSIWGWVLCLLIARRGENTKNTADADGVGQQMMEKWIASTQLELNDEE